MDIKRKSVILLNDEQCDFKKIKDNLKNDWDILVEQEDIDGKLEFNIGNTIVEISFQKEITKREDVEKEVKDSNYWENGIEDIKKIKSFIEVSILGKKDIEKIAKLFVKINASILKLSNTLGICDEIIALPAKVYIEIAQQLKDGELPVLALVNINFYKTDNGISSYTKGMVFFDKKEIEILDTDIEFSELFDFMLDIVDYVISSDIKLNDGETIGFSNEQQIPIVVSQGVAINEDSIKIKVTTENY